MTYRGKTLTWANGRQLVGYDGHTFTYDGQGRRLTKDGISFTYDSNGRIIKQSNGLEFFYDHTGVAGVKYNTQTYFYRKDVQGNVIGLVDQNGVVIASYFYDAWGAVHAVTDNNGAEITNANHIANLNPFRYRSYYYDSDIKLYFLKTRYYDPETCRFINADDISYLDPETINGLNLYIYCSNNPVMGVDPDGTIDWGRVWRTIGVLFAAAAILAVTAAISIVTIGSAAPVIAGMVVGFALGAGGSAITQALFTGEVDFGKVLLDGFVGAISGAVAVTAISLGGSIIFGAALSGAASIGEDIIDGTGINGGKLLLSVGLGAVSGLVSGSGLDAKTYMSKSKYFDSILKTAVSTKKIAMYTQKFAKINKEFLVGIARFSASIITGHLASKGLGLIFNKE